MSSSIRPDSSPPERAGTGPFQPDPNTAGAESELGSVFVSNYPPFSFWGEDDLPAVEAALDAAPRAGVPLGLYLHIPFCRKRCRFCYFRVYTDKNFDEIGSYLDALATEVEAYAERAAVAGRPLQFVYFGGGTPSYVSVKQLRALVERLERAIPWTGAAEVAFECEPGTLTRSKVEAIRGIGVTRLSLGIENFDDEILRLNGRAHLSGEIERCREWIAQAGFDQLNVDLIAGMLGERWESWRATVEKTIDFGPDSVTIYQLELPHNTGFARGVREGSLESPVADWATKRAWHEYANERLREAGYVRSSAYTMVRADRPGHFVYRDSVWQGCDLLGAGVASFSHLSGVHFQNADGWGEYLARVRQGALPHARAFATSADERLTRELILQLKLGTVAVEPFREKFGVDVRERFRAAFARLAATGLAVVDGETIRVSPEGLLRVDTLLPELYDARYQNSRYT